MKNRAFTLIELLVVVLIIGILTSIALPQYQKAVVKSRYTGLKSLAHAIANAERVYYLSNGSYTNNFDDLDVQTPAYTSEETIMDASGEELKRVVRKFDGEVSCYLQDKKYIVCTNSLANMRYYINFSTNKITCYANNTNINSIQNQICKAETGKTTYSGKTDSSSSSQYMYWEY